VPLYGHLPGSRHIPSTGYSLAESEPCQPTWIVPMRKRRTKPSGAQDARMRSGKYPIELEARRVLRAAVPTPPCALGAFHCHVTNLSGGARSGGAVKRIARHGSGKKAGRRLPSDTAYPPSLAWRSLRRQTSEVRAVCNNPARTDLCGGARQLASLPRCLGAKTGCISKLTLGRSRLGLNAEKGPANRDFNSQAIGYARIKSNLIF
jgi:hypothetical protein